MLSSASAVRASTNTLPWFVSNTRKSSSTYLSTQCPPNPGGKSCCVVRACGRGVCAVCAARSLIRAPNQLLSGVTEDHTTNTHAHARTHARLAQLEQPAEQLEIGVTKDDVDAVGAADFVAPAQLCAHRAAEQRHLRLFQRVLFCFVMFAVVVRVLADARPHISHVRDTLDAREGGARSGCDQEWLACTHRKSEEDGTWLMYSAGDAAGKI